MMKKTVLICAVITLLCIGATVALWFAVNGAQAEYTQVEATVVSSETKTKRVMGKKLTYYEVIVRYEGQKYELKNPHNSYSFQPGRQVTVYLSNGALYANVEGVKTSTPLAMVYFGFLFASFGMIAVTAVVWSKGRKKGT